MIEFKAFEKIARLNREVVVTEKIDGTNGQVFIERVPLAMPPIDSEHQLAEQIDEAGYSKLVMYAGSRNKWLTRTSDNAGFAKWVQENATSLFGLGEGQHFGEWWGSGIQRRYGLKEKRFSLFNVHRWVHVGTPIEALADHHEYAPACCHVVPILGTGTLALVGRSVEMLRESGSVAAPGFADPEGVVVYHTAAKTLFKVTLKDDEKPKGNRGNAG